MQLKDPQLYGLRKFWNEPSCPVLWSTHINLCTLVQSWSRAPPSAGAPRSAIPMSGPASDVLQGSLGHTGDVTTQTGHISQSPLSLLWSGHSVWNPVFADSDSKHSQLPAGSSFTERQVLVPRTTQRSSSPLPIFFSGCVQKIMPIVAINSYGFLSN